MSRNSLAMEQRRIRVHDGVAAAPMYTDLSGLFTRKTTSRVFLATIFIVALKH
jgi:hypothetical protein